MILHCPSCGRTTAWAGHAEPGQEPLSACCGVRCRDAGASPELRLARATARLAAAFTRLAHSQDQRLPSQR